MCGIGVTSLIIVISNPAVCKALIAASLPAPGPLTYTSTVFSPCSIAALEAVSENEFNTVNSLQDLHGLIQKSAS